MQKKHIYRVMVVLALLGLAILNCGWLFNVKKPEKITVFAASSLTDVLKEAAKMYEAEHKEVKIVFNFASSGALQTQIEQGAEADIFASAANKHMYILLQEKLFSGERIFDLAGNQLAVIAQKDSNLTVHSPADLLQAQSIAIGYPNSVAVGKYSSEMLKHQHLWEQIKDRLVYAINDRQVLQLVESGKAEVGIVYVTDLRASTKVKSLYTVPTKMHTGINCPIGTLNNSQHAKAANAFVDWLMSEEGRELFEEYGFSVED